MNAQVYKQCMESSKDAYSFSTKMPTCALYHWTLLEDNRGLC